jgi:hypothetical protein
MKGCGLQKYAFFPTVLKVREYLCPLPKNPELNDPFFAVAVCWVLSLLIQMTFVPGLMVMLAGLNLNPWIKTVLVGCFCAPAADESARPAPPTSPSVPSFKNSLRVIAMQLRPYGLRGRSALHLGACVFSGEAC